MGDVIGDINARRGRIEGMEDIGGGKMIRLMYRLQRCSVTPQTCVPRLRVVVTTPCSSRSTSRYRRISRRRYSLLRNNYKNNCNPVFLAGLR